MLITFSFNVKNSTLSLLARHQYMALFPSKLYFSNTGLVQDAQMEVDTAPTCYREITSLMRLRRVKFLGNTRRTGIICSSRPVKKPLLLQVTPPPSINDQRIVLEMRRKRMARPFRSKQEVSETDQSGNLLVFIGCGTIQKVDCELVCAIKILLFIPLAH